MLSLVILSMESTYFFPKQYDDYTYGIWQMPLFRGTYIIISLYI